MNRTLVSLAGVTAALVAVTGVAALQAPADDSDTTPTSAAGGVLPVERSSLVCPAPTSSELGETTYTAVTPKPAKGGPAGQRGTAELRPAHRDTESGKKPTKSGKKGGADKPVLSLEKPGTPVTSRTLRSDAPALTGTADGALAPGWTVQQTSLISAGDGRGLIGTACAAPDTDFWFPGASTGADRQDYVHLTNPDDSSAVVDVQLYGKDGKLDTPDGESITVPAHSTEPVLLSTLTTDTQVNVTVHVEVRSGRVGANIQATDSRRGGDWLPASADPAAEQVLPGIPKDATAVRLVAFAPGGDADLRLRLAGSAGLITPAGHESLHVKSKMTAAVDLDDVTRGEPGSLLLSSRGHGSSRVVAALRVTRGKGEKQEIAFIPATGAISGQATAADNRTKTSTLSLTAPEKTARVRVTTSAGTGGGTAKHKTFVVKKGATLAVPTPRPSGGKGGYAVTVRRLSGGPVHASRMLAEPTDGVPMFTVQTLPDDQGTVRVPDAAQDLSLLSH